MQSRRIALASRIWWSAMCRLNSTPGAESCSGVASFMGLIPCRSDVRIRHGGYIANNKNPNYRILGMSPNLIAESKAKVSDKGMSPKESEILMDELKAWCDERYGRRAEVAEGIGVSRQIVSDWIKGRAIPNLDNGLALQAFLRKRRRRQK
jgi:hypothetical protein